MIYLKYLKPWVFRSHITKSNPLVSIIGGSGITITRSLNNSCKPTVIIHNSTNILLQQSLPKPYPPNRRKFLTSNGSAYFLEKMRLYCIPALRPLPFHHDENMNAARILKSLPNYKNLMFEEDENILQEGGKLMESVSSSGGTLSVEGATLKPEKKVRDSVARFIEASFESQEAQLPVTHPKNEDVVKNVMKELSSLTDQELCQILYFCRWFAPCPSSKDPPYLKFWTDLDKECLRRSTSWSIDFSFTVADLWYGLGLARMSEFHWTLLKRLFRKCDKLKKEHFVRFMFCLNLNREIPPNANSYDLEYNLSRLVDQLTAEELVIIAMGFFKTQRVIRDPELLKKALLIIMNSSETLDSVSVSAVAKLARHSSDVRSHDIIIEFQKKFLPELSRISITACTHLALTGTNAVSPYRPLVQAVVDRIESNISEARLKELERICLAATMFSVHCKPLCQKVVTELQSSERADEIRKYGRCLPAILHYLSIEDIFVPDLMSTCLSKAFRDTYYGKSKEIFQRELLCLDVAAGIDLENYSGHRLEQKMFNLIMKKNIFRTKSPFKQKVSNYERFTRSVMEGMTMVLKDKELFYLCNILPQHSTMAIIYCRDKEGKLVPVPESYYQMAAHEIKKIPNSDLDFHALVLCSRGLYITNTKDFSGQANLQVRQIKRLGYKTKLVCQLEWDTLTDLKARKTLIENHIS